MLNLFKDKVKMKVTPKRVAFFKESDGKKVFDSSKEKFNGNFQRYVFDRYIINNIIFSETV
jgi:hypothetical protein